jgi:hypothetical protein
MSFSSRSFSSSTLGVIRTSTSSVVWSRRKRYGQRDEYRVIEAEAMYLLMDILPQIDRLLVSDLDVRQVKTVDQELDTLRLACMPQ